MPTAEIIKFQGRREVRQFVCSACGADRGCDCNAPAVEKLAEITEQRRQASKAYRKRKAKQKQSSRDITLTVEDDLEPDEYREAFLMRTADAMSFAVYSGKVDRSVIAAAKRVALKWTNFAQTLEDRYGKEST